jgi:hypothetical protein
MSQCFHDVLDAGGVCGMYDCLFACLVLKAAVQPSEKIPEKEGDNSGYRKNYGCLIHISLL